MLFIFSITLTKVSFSNDVIKITNKITASTLKEKRKEIVKLVREGSKKITLKLNSDGGDLLASIQFVDFIRNFIQPIAHITTYVSSRCSSACTVLFTAGQSREVKRYASFMFHTPKISSSNIPLSIEREKDLLLQARQSWLEKVSQVDLLLSEKLRNKKILEADYDFYFWPKSLKTGYITKVIKRRN